MTYATWPLSPSISGSRTRTPGVSVRVRAGPSRWVSQCRLPRTTTALARPVSSTQTPSTCWAAGTWYVRRPAARAAQVYVEAVGHGAGGEVVDEPQFARALVHDPGAVVGGVAGVELGVVGVAAQVGAVVGAGVEVADALVVGEEGDAVADEHRGVEVAVEVGEEAAKPCSQSLPVAPPR